MSYEIVSLVLSAETHPGEGISSINSRVGHGPGNPSLPAPLCSGAERCRRCFHPEGLFLEPLLVPLQPSRHPLERPVEMQVLLQGSLPFAHQFVPVAGVTGGAGLCAQALCWLCWEAVGDFAKSHVVP